MLAERCAEFQLARWFSNRNSGFIGRTDARRHSRGGEMGVNIVDGTRLASRETQYAELLENVNSSMLNAILGRAHGGCAGVHSR
jgi:hypothetical protein